MCSKGTKERVNGRMRGRIREEDRMMTQKSDSYNRKGGIGPSRKNKKKYE